jgi:hypothetical protein
VCTDLILSEADETDLKDESEEEEEDDDLKDNVGRIANALEGLARIAEGTQKTLIKIDGHLEELKTRVIFSAPPVKPVGAGARASSSRLGAGTISRFANGDVHPKPKGRPNKMARDVDPWNCITGCWIDKDGNDIL